MPKALVRKVAEYRRVLAQTEEYRKIWDESLENSIVASLKELAEASELGGSIEVREQIANLAAVTFSLGYVRSGLIQDVAQGVRRELVKHNGSLVYQQLYNGKVTVIIQYPYIENHDKKKDPKTIGIFRPDELRSPYFQRHLEEFLSELIKWEDFDDEPSQKIGFKFNFEREATEIEPPPAPSSNEAPKAS